MSSSLVARRVRQSRERVKRRGAAKKSSIQEASVTRFRSRQEQVDISIFAMVLRGSSERALE